MLRLDVAGYKNHHKHKKLQSQSILELARCIFLRAPGVAVSMAWAPVTSTANTKRSDAGERHLADFREIVLVTRFQTISYGL